MIDAVGVVIPVRDEQDRIIRCLRSVRAALRVLPGSTRHAVAVVLDRCTDGTALRVAAELDGWPEASAVHLVRRPPPAELGEARYAAPRSVVASGPRQPGVGWVRDVGIGHLLARLGPIREGHTWLLSTDADTTVPPDWVTAHLRFAAAGLHGVAGVADLSGPTRLSAEAAHLYRLIVSDGLHGGRHDHVYAANLGVRADAYLSVGGFPATGHGEDHGLWRRLDAAGYRLVQPTGVRVHTSARTRGRAAGGLADLLRSLHAANGPQPGGTTVTRSAAVAVPPM